MRRDNYGIDGAASVKEVVHGAPGLLHGEVRPRHDG